MRCDKCRKRWGCKLSTNHWRMLFFAYARDGEAPECKEFEPEYYHGLEGVYL